MPIQRKRGRGQRKKATNVGEQIRKMIKVGAGQAVRERKKAGEEEVVSGTAVRAAAVGTAGVKAGDMGNSGRRSLAEQAEKKESAEDCATQKEGGVCKEV